MLNLLHKKCKLGGVRGQMPNNANVICEGSLSVVQLKGKHCRKPHCRNGVVDKFGHSLSTVPPHRSILGNLQGRVTEKQ